MGHAPVDVDVQIDQPWCHQLARCMNDRFGLFLVDLLRNGGYSPIGNPDVSDGVEALRRVDQRRTAYEEVVAGSHGFPSLGCLGPWYNLWTWQRTIAGPQNTTKKGRLQPRLRQPSLGPPSAMPSG